MDNKLTSLLIKGGMAIIFVIGAFLIWKNLSYGSGDEEPINNQAFFTKSYLDYSKDSLNPKEIDLIQFDYVIDNDYNMVVNLKSGELYKLGPFVKSDGQKKELKELTEDQIEEYGGKTVEDIVDPVIIDQYKLQSATSRSVNFTYYLMYFGLFLIAVFSAINIFQNPKRFLRSAIGMVALAIISFICYKVASNSAISVDGEIDTVYKMTGMGIGIFITLSVIAVGLILLGSILGVARYFSK